VCTTDDMPEKYSYTPRQLDAIVRMLKLSGEYTGEQLAGMDKLTDFLMKVETIDPDTIGEEVKRCFHRL